MTVNQAAIDRKNRFLEEKKSVSSVKELVKHKVEQPFTLWFNSEGDILSFSQNEIAPRNGWYTYDFEPEQLSVLYNGTHNYIVVKDQLVENKYSIQRKVLEEQLISKEEYFLHEVPFVRVSPRGIRLELTKNHLKIALDTNIKQLYEGISPVKATAKSQRTFEFYITKTGDPHILYDQGSVYFSQLLTSDVVKIKLNKQLPKEVSIYTKKLFESKYRYSVTDKRKTN